MTQSNAVTATSCAVLEDLDIAWDRAVSAQQELVDAQVALENAEQEVCLANSELSRVQSTIFDHWYNEDPKGFLTELSADVPDPARVPYLQKLGLVNPVLATADTPAHYVWGSMAVWFKRVLEKM